MKLDEYDLKLINLLKENSRLTITELSKLVNLSRPTVKERIERLEKEGFITKYTIKLSPELEYRGNYFIIFAKSTKMDDYKKLKEIREVREIIRVLGEKYLLKVVARNVKDLSKLEKAGIEIIEILPVIEIIENESDLSLKLNFRCDYCGKEINEEPIIYRHHNRVFFLCCNTCLGEFKRI